MTKKLIALVLMLALTLTACGGGGSSSSSSSAASTPASSTAPAGSAAPSDAAPAEEVVKLRLSSNVGSNEISENKTAMAAGLNAWINTVQEASGGSIEIELFTDSQLASGTDAIVSGIQTKAFEVAHFSTGNWAEYTDAFAEFNVPFLYSSYDEVQKVMESEVGTAMMDKLAADVPGIKPLAYIHIGFRDITNSKQEIKTPADMKGLKIRTMSDTYQIAAMEALGATVTTVPISELYSSLQQKMVDAQENPVSTIFNNKFYEVQTYLTLTHHSYTSTFMFMNDTVYDSLSDAQKAAVDQANAACTAASMAAAPSAETEFTQLLETEGGMTVYQPTAEELAEFKAACAPVWEQVEQAMGTDRWSALMTVLGL